MYQPYPGSTELPETQRPPVPSPVITAVRVMYAGAVASLAYGASYLISQSAITTAVRDHSPHLTAAQVTNSQHALVFGGLAGAIVAAGLWLFVARACLRGRGWARILGSVLFGVFTVDSVVGLFLPQLPVLVKLIALAGWILGLWVIVLLWRRSSSGFFR